MLKKIKENSQNKTFNEYSVNHKKEKIEFKKIAYISSLYFDRLVCSTDKRQVRKYRDVDKVECRVDSSVEEKRKREKKHYY